MDCTKVFAPDEPRNYTLHAHGEQVLLMPGLYGDNAPLVGWYSTDGRHFAPVPVDISALGIPDPPVMRSMVFRATQAPWPVLSDGRFFLSVEALSSHYLAEARLSPDRITVVPSPFVRPEPDVVNTVALGQDARGTYWLGANLHRDSAIGRIYRSGDLVSWTQVGGNLPDGIGRVYHVGERLFFSAYGRVIEVSGDELVERAKFKDWVRAVHVDERGGIHVFMDFFLGTLGAGQKRTKNAPVPFSPTASGRPEGIAVDGGYLMAHGGMWSSKDGLAFGEEAFPAPPGTIQQIHAVPGGALVLAGRSELYFVRL